jgi:hypothetical protein
MEVDESFSQKEEVQQHVCRQSDVENMGASNSDDKDSELPDLADRGVSDNDADSSDNDAKGTDNDAKGADHDTEGAGNDTEGAEDAADDDQGSLQQASKVSVC